jgi:hypothetical protein
MPYYVFRLRPFTMPEQVAEYAAFRDASAHAKALRAAGRDAASDGRIKVMFADNPTLAEDLLCQIREPGPAGDD